MGCSAHRAHHCWILNPVPIDTSLWLVNESTDFPFQEDAMQVQLPPFPAQQGDTTRASSRKHWISYSFQVTPSSFTVSMHGIALVDIPRRSGAVREVAGASETGRGEQCCQLAGWSLDALLVVLCLGRSGPAWVETGAAAASTPTAASPHTILGGRPCRSIHGFLRACPPTP